MTGLTQTLVTLADFVRGYWIIRIYEWLVTSTITTTTFDNQGTKVVRLVELRVEGLTQPVIWQLTSPQYYLAYLTTTLLSLKITYSYIPVKRGTVEFCVTVQYFLKCNLSALSCVTNTVYLVTITAQLPQFDSTFGAGAAHHSSTASTDGG
jgi:hypothetical protein